MALLRESLEPRTPLTSDQYYNLDHSLRELGHALLRVTCEVFVDFPYKREGVIVKAHRAYHPQDDLPDDYEVAVWGQRIETNKQFWLLQQIVAWDGDDETIMTPARRVVIRPDGPNSLVEIPGLCWTTAPYEESAKVIDDTFDTIDFYAAVHGVEVRPRPHLLA